jgi:sensor domain CHASE-containing protein
MKLRNKTFLFILMIWTFMFLVVLFGIQSILINNYLQIETKLSTDAVSRIQGALRQQVNAVGETANLWGIWDDAYNYAQGKNQNFLDQAVSIASMAAAHLDLVLIFDAKGNILFKRKLNDNRTMDMPVPENFIKAFAAGGELHKYIANPTEKSAMRGTFAFDETIYLVGEHAIVTNAGTGPAEGSFFVGKIFTNADWQAIQQSTKLQADIFPINKIAFNPQLKTSYNALLNNDAVLLDRVNSTHIHAFAFIRDINNMPLAMMKVFLPRDVYQAGLGSIWHFISLFLLLGLIFSLLLFYLLRKIVLNPLESINKEIALVGQTKNFQTRIAGEGADEISNMSSEFNNMFTTIFHYNQKNKVYREEISDKLEKSKNLREKLQKTEIFLTDVINSMPSILLVIDEEMQIIKMNNQAGIEIPGESILGQSLFTCFPYLVSYKNKIDRVFETAVPQLLTKIVDNSLLESRHFNVLVFPLAKQKSIALRIDDVTVLFKLQNQIMQHEKLASIGMLTTDVVNEINDPLNECFTTITPLKNNLLTIMELVNKYYAISLDEKCKTMTVSVNKKATNSDIEGLLIETHKLLDSLQKNAANIAAIVKVLQNFSRVDNNVSKD